MFQIIKNKNLIFKVNGTSPNIGKIREAIKNATSLQEVEQLNRLLQSRQFSDDSFNLDGK